MALKQGRLVWHEPCKQRLTWCCSRCGRCRRECGRADPLCENSRVRFSGSRATRPVGEKHLKPAKRPRLATSPRSGRRHKAQGEAQRTPGSSRKQSKEPAERPIAGEISNTIINPLSAASRALIVFQRASWGFAALHPRLYAIARSAGLGLHHGTRYARSFPACFPLKPTAHR